MYMSSVMPKNMRYRLLNVEQDQGIKLTVWYSRSNRLDVYVDDKLVMATNAQVDDKGRYTTTMPKGKTKISTII